MTNPLVHSFFVGRAFAEALGEELEYAFSNGLSELGKFDAEQRDYLRQFTDRVLERAAQAEEQAMQGQTTTSALVKRDTQPADLQATIDELRAEIAQLRAELQRYRSRSA